MEGGAVAVFAAGERALLTARCELLERVLHALNDAITVRDRFGAIVFQNRAAHLPSARVLNTDFITTLATPLPPLPSSGCATEATGLGASPSDGSAIEVRSSMSWENPLVRRILDGVPQNAWQNPASTGAVDFHNKWWFNYTGLQPGASCGWGWKQVVHPDDVERASATWMASFEAGEICLAELRIRGADGIYRWFLSCGTPLLNDAGVVARWMGTAIDISAQKALQDALEDERALLNTALDQLPVGVIIAEASAGSFRFINKKMHELSQAAPDGCEIRDSTQWKGFHSDGRLYQATDWPLSRSLTIGEIVVGEDTIFERKDGSRATIRIWSASARSTDGTIVAAVAVAEDVTGERVRAGERVRLLAAEQTAKATTNLMANVSHELRTPLHGILGLADLALHERHLGKQLREYLAQIRQSGKLLLVVINDVLDHSKIAAGKLELEGIPFRMHTVIAHVMSLMTEIAKAKSVTLREDMAANLPAVVEGDPQRLKQICMNLLSNAIRFTPPGGVVTLKGQLEGITDKKAVLQFQVQDSGIGMSAETLTRLFTPFTQADASTTRRFGGTGLGLAISKQLVTLMSGQISVISEPGVGSAFTFTVHLPVCDANTVIADSPLIAAETCASDSGTSSPSSSLTTHCATRPPPEVPAPPTGDVPGPTPSPNALARRVSGYHPSPLSYQAHAAARAGLLAHLALAEPPVEQLDSPTCRELSVSCQRLACFAFDAGVGGPSEKPQVSAPALQPSPGVPEAGTQDDAVGTSAAAANRARAADACVGAESGKFEQPVSGYVDEIALTSGTPCRCRRTSGPHSASHSAANRARAADCGSPEAPRASAAVAPTIVSVAPLMALAPRQALWVSGEHELYQAGAAHGFVHASDAACAAAAPPPVLAEGSGVGLIRSATTDSEACQCSGLAGSALCAQPTHITELAYHERDGSLGSCNDCELATEPTPAGAGSTATSLGARTRRTASCGSSGGESILLVEDNAVNTLIAKRFLRNLGYRSVTHVENGQAAVDALAAGEFDLVLMDCQMPVMDGFEATRLIRSLPDESARSVPIIALTASALKADVDRCLAAGMDDHLSKPYGSKALGAKLMQWLHLLSNVA